jgi:hypothetical protein
MQAIVVLHRSAAAGFMTGIRGEGMHAQFGRESFERVGNFVCNTMIDPCITSSHPRKNTNNLESA